METALYAQNKGGFIGGSLAVPILTYPITKGGKRIMLW